jgi:hypothetical protein
MENGATGLGETTSVNARGASAAADFATVRSPETYVGSRRAESFASPGGFKSGTVNYALPASFKLNEWGLSGRWAVEPQRAVLAEPNGRIAFRFHARDLHLVLGSASGKPVRFRVLIDGKAPGKDHGMEIDEVGNGSITGQRLYQLVRQKGGSRERLFTITFRDPNVEAYAFTFG